MQKPSVKMVKSNNDMRTRAKKITAAQKIEKTGRLIVRCNEPDLGYSCLEIFLARSWGRDTALTPSCRPFGKRSVP